MPVKNIIPGQKVAREKLERARQLQRAMTPAEKVLWEGLRKHRLGPHFRRQQVIAGFIVDFYCHAARLVIEVDGDVHLEQVQADARRDEGLEEMGLRVLHVRNDLVLGDLEGVLARIRALLAR